MARIAKLFGKVRNNPQNIRFDELCRLLEAVGFAHARTRGSHTLYTHPDHPTLLVNLQSGSDGKAKVYQVKQVLAMIDEHELAPAISDGEENEDEP